VHSARKDLRPTQERAGAGRSGGRAERTDRKPGEKKKGSGGRSQADTSINQRDPRDGRTYGTQAKRAVKNHRGGGVI